MDDVIVEPYDPNWQLHYEIESKLIRNVIDPGLIERIEHFGSTSIQGLAAKPIIDLLVEVRSLAKAKQLAITPLAKLGYAYWSDNPDRQRMFFVKGLPPNGPRTHHIHMVESDSPLWERLLFRDYLRHNSMEAARYEQLKYKLASQFKHDREAYTAGKSDYINSVMQQIRKQNSSDSLLADSAEVSNQR